MLTMELTSLLMDVLRSTIEKTTGVYVRSAKTSDDAEPTPEKVDLERLKVEARVVQEIAIARRIETADKVEIEEYYDYHGKVSLGVQSSGDGIHVGASGEGQRVSKRIYRFIGWNSGIVQHVEEIEQRSTDKES